MFATASSHNAWASANFSLENFRISPCFLSEPSLPSIQIRCKTICDTETFVSSVVSKTEKCAPIPLLLPILTGGIPKNGSKRLESILHVIDPSASLGPPQEQTLTYSYCKFERDIDNMIFAIRFCEKKLRQAIESLFLVHECAHLIAFSTSFAL